MGWFWVWWSYYYPGLRYSLILNVTGVGLILRAWRGDLVILRNTTRVPPWFLVTVGLALQLPGLVYIAVGVWSGSDLVTSLPGAEPPPLGPR